jgi:leader peptidase (prepilin peptidase)/N-methyltransferase
MFIDLLPGIVWSCFLGLVIGNFATNPIYRLPRNESLFLKDPYCGDCGAYLMPRDLFPVFSWLATKGKCRYCKSPIPAAYAATETLIAALYMLCYIKYGFSEQFILISFGLTTLVMLGMMFYLDNFFSNKTLIACYIFAMLYRTLMEGTIYGFAGGAFAALAAGLVVWKISGRPLVRDLIQFPSYLKLLVAAGLWLPPLHLVALLFATLVTVPLVKDEHWMSEWMIITGIIILTFIHM